jgi:glucose-1-phosphatase
MHEGHPFFQSSGPPESAAEAGAVQTLRDFASVFRFPPMNSPVIVFDLGKVLVDFDYSIAARRIAARSTQPLENLDAFLSSSSALIQFETGLITRQQFFDQVRNATGFLGDIGEFGGMFADIFTEVSPMIAFHSELRRRGLKTYIFSNTNDLAIEHIRRNFPFFENFDGYIFSCEVKAMKPDALIYRALEQMTGRRCDEIIYIDDRIENVAGGAACGWRTILHETPEKTRAAMNVFGF